MGLFWWCLNFQLFPDHDFRSVTSQEQKSFVSASSLMISSPKFSLYKHYALTKNKELSCIRAVRILEDWGCSCFTKLHCYFPLLLWHRNHVLQFPLWLGGEIWGGHVHLPRVRCGSETCPRVPQGLSTVCNKPDIPGANLPAVTVSFLVCYTLLPPYFLATPRIFTLSNDGECYRYRLFTSAFITPPEEQAGTFFKSMAFGTAGQSCCRLPSHGTGKGKNN